MLFMFKKIVRLCAWSFNSFSISEISEIIEGTNYDHEFSSRVPWAPDTFSASFVESALSTIHIFFFLPLSSRSTRSETKDPAIPPEWIMTRAHWRKEKTISKNTGLRLIKC